MKKKINLRQEFLLPKDHNYFNHCHASTVLKVGEHDLLCAYMAGEREGQPDMSIWLSRRKNGSWQKPERIQSIYGLPHWNPVLHRDGSRILLYYKVGLSVQTWYTMLGISEDEGETWSHPVEAVPEDHTPRVCVRNKLLVSSRGDWLGPVSVENGRLWDSYIDISRDKGKSWTTHAIPFTHQTKAENGAGSAAWEGLKEGALWENDLSTVLKWDGIIQPALWESQPGHIHAMMRSTRGKIYRSDSCDYGESWSEAYATSMPNNNSGIDIARLACGALVLVYNPVSGNWDARSPLSVSLSVDNGQTFSAPIHLETQPGEYSYPAIVTEGSTAHITYTHKRKNMVYTSFELV